MNTVFVTILLITQHPPPSPPYPEDYPDPEPKETVWNGGFLNCMSTAELLNTIHSDHFTFECVLEPIDLEESEQ